jgi:hypothetical protein
VQPFDRERFGHLRLDAERYVAIPIRAVSGANFGVRGAAGLSAGGDYQRNFFLSSFDTLRGVQFNDANWLLGSHFAYATAEVQVPVDAVLRTAVLSSIEGVAGIDVGGVSTSVAGLWDERVLDVAVGANMILGPLVFRVHFARPLDVGAPLPTGSRPQWVPNLSMRWLSL